MPNLTKMTISECSCLEVFQTQIPWLNVICDSEKLQQLYVINCPDLKTLVHSTPSVTFTYVKEMYIDNCNELTYLFTLSSVNKLENLEHIEVTDCESMEAIVLKEEDDISEEIKLQKLKRVELNDLSSLECFYSGNDTLRLPSLMQVDIWICPKMEFFSRGDIYLNSSFKGIQASNVSSDDLVFHHDLNSSVQKVFLVNSRTKELAAENNVTEQDCEIAISMNFFVYLFTLIHDTPWLNALLSFTGRRLSCGVYIHKEMRQPSFLRYQRHPWLTNN